jgi:putative glutamine amidotransferase
MARRPLRIGLSARIYHPQPGASGLQSKSLQYLEQSVAHWVMSRDVMVFMIPSISGDGMIHRSSIRLSDYAGTLDGLILQGGADISPQCYGEDPRHPDWVGDRQRDAYEMELFHEFMEAGRPILGICRGCQLINVALGGTLYQDIETQYEQAAVHVHPDYDKYSHAITWGDDSGFGKLYPEPVERKVVSIHHQAIRTLGKGLRVEARSVDDQLIEAIRLEGKPYVLGLQWHPEFHPPGFAGLLDCTPILDEFLNAARGRRW